MINFNEIHVGDKLKVARGSESVVSVVDSDIIASDYLQRIVKGTIIEIIGKTTLFSGGRFNSGRKTVFFMLRNRLCKAGWGDLRRIVDRLV